MNPPAGELLRLVTTGSVDDGKSTLVGRLLHDTQSVLSDQIEAITRASQARGLPEPDLALLVDGLRAERDQGITIDVAYRYFCTARRSFVMADTPGHVQYTRNTVSGASTAQLAIVLVDARKGVVAQTRRHTAILSLLGVPRLVLAVNKIDLIDDPEQVYSSIATDFRAMAATLGWSDATVHAIPVSALYGDNIVVASTRTPFYDGPTLLEHLETVPIDDPGRTGQSMGLRFPVQYVIRPRDEKHHDYRGYAGRVQAGTAHPGQQVVVLPAGIRTTVSGIDTADGAVDCAYTDQSVTILLSDDIDVSRGDLISSIADQPEPRTQFAATICWLSDKTLRPGTRALVKHGTKTVAAIIDSLQQRLDEQEMRMVSDPESLALNDIALVSVHTAEPILPDHYAANRSSGSFLIIDPASGDTLAAGLVGHALKAIV